MLNVLMKEARLTTVQRKLLMNNLRSGSRCSTTTSATSATSINRSESTTAVKRCRSFKPRTLKDIVESGAYLRESYVPSTKGKNYVMEKEKLQSIMTYGEDMKLNQGKNIKLTAQKPSQGPAEELIDHLISDIGEREKFLINIEQLSKSSENSSKIIHQIRCKIKKLEAIIGKTPNKYRSAEVRKLTEIYRTPLGIPKPIPGFKPIM